MKKIKKILLLLLLVIITLQGKITIFADEIPYYTFTSDSQNELLRTQTAYTPKTKISNLNGQRLKVPEHIFVDKDDYIYITDSDLNKIFILDSTYNYSGELASNEWATAKSTFVSEDIIYVVDDSDAKILLFDKFSHELLDTIGTPDSPVFKEGYAFKPTHIAVDVRGNIYVRGTESSNGLMMLNREGEFITFFGANTINVPLLDQVRSIFLTEKQKRDLGTFFPDIISNVAVDSKGFIYTATSSIEKSPVKKFNVSGKNYFSDDLIGDFNMESIWAGQYDNIYALTSDGWIYEYDSQGKLLFMFGGNDVNSSRFGILKRPISIASNSLDQLFVVDQGSANIQVYDRTSFSDAVHRAMESYQSGDYAKSQSLWEYTLQYNSVYDNSRIGLGNAFTREGEYTKALDEFSLAQNNEGISEAFWEIRQVWLSEKLNVIFTIFLLIIVLFYVYRFFNKKYGYSKRLKSKLSPLKNYRFIDNFLFIFEFNKSPLDGIYEIKKTKRVSKFFTTFLYLSYILLYLCYYKFSNVIFVPRDQFIAYQLSIVIFLFILWIASTYLICSISDGEGTLIQTYNGVAYAMTPLLYVMPAVILFSNVLTLEQSVFYYLPQVLMLVWIIGLFFFMIKDLHNYEVGETVSIILKSIFTMLIIGIFIFVLYTLGSQLVGFVVDIITEVRRR